MVKVSGFRRLLLVALVLIVCRNNLVGAVEFRTFNMPDPAAPAAGSDTAKTATIGGLWSKWKPYYTWLPPDTCGWDYASTAYWWIVFDGATVCSDTYGKSLAISARNTMGKAAALRTFKVNTGTIICTLDKSRKRAMYTMSINAPPATMRNLRNLRFRAAMRTVVARSNVVNVRSAVKGTGKFFSSDWVYNYWCNGCPLTPDWTNPNFAIENVTYSCTTTTPNSETCPYTCPDGFEPAAETDPVCIAAGWKFSWAQGTGGLPSCVSIAPATCGAINTALLPSDYNVATGDCSGTAIGDTCDMTCDNTIQNPDGLPVCIEDAGGNAVWDYSEIVACKFPLPPLPAP